MKQLFLTTLIFSCLFTIHAQKIEKPNSPFVRVYNIDGKKIGKGRILKITTNELELWKNGSSDIYKIEQIGYLRTKRSSGHNVLLGIGTGVILFGSMGAIAGSEGDSFFFASGAEYGASFGAVLGSFLGAIVGVVTTIFKNSERIQIDGDVKKWEVFMSTWR